MTIYYRYVIDDIKYESTDFIIKKYNDIEYLNCYNNKLTNLPKLPLKLKTLYCEYNKLNNLPILSNNLIKLICEYNKLTNLPELPNSLIDLDCFHNKIIYLPILPNKLIYLECSENKLITLSKINKHKINKTYSYNLIKYINIYDLSTIQIKIYNYIKF